MEIKVFAVSLYCRLGVVKTYLSNSFKYNE